MSGFHFRAAKSRGLRRRARPAVEARRLALAAFAALALPCAARAEAVPAAISRQFDTAAESGPRALLDDLARVLAANPSLVATPGAAAALARAAASPVPDFVGANLPVYREIEARIVSAAPAPVRDAVRRAVDRELSGYAATDIRIMPPLPAMGPANLRRQPPEIGPAGYKVGDYTIYPSIQAGTFYDDNIYATRTGRVADAVGTISPVIAIQSNWKRNALYAEVGADLTGYWTHGNENTADWHAQVEGRIDVNAKTRVVLGGIVLHEHEDRSSPDAVEGLTPTPYTEMNAYAGVIRRVGTFSIRTGAAVERLTFGNVEGLHGEINNQDRDRNRYTFGILARDDARPGFRPYAELLGDLRRYDTVPDDFQYFYFRNSDGFRAGVGALFRLLPSLSGDAFVGVMHRDYADSRFKTITTPAGSADLRWQAGEDTALTLFIDRSIEETTLPGSPAYIYTLVGGRIEHAITDDLTGIVRAAFARSDFAQSTRWDNEADMSVGLRYRLMSRVFLGVDYRYTQRISSDSIFNFRRNQVYLELTEEF